MITLTGFSYKPQCLYGNTISQDLTLNNTLTYEGLAKVLDDYSKIVLLKLPRNVADDLIIKLVENRKITHLKGLSLEDCTNLTPKIVPYLQQLSSLKELVIRDSGLAGEGKNLERPGLLVTNRKYKNVS